MQIPKSMTAAECWQLVGSRGVGRIGFDAGSGPRIHPVDYSCDGSDVYVRTAPTSELARFTRIFAKGGVVSFETDQLDASRGECWSVLISGSVEAAGNAPDESGPVAVTHSRWGLQLLGSPATTAGDRASPGIDGAALRGPRLGPLTVPVRPPNEPRARKEHVDDVCCYTWSVEILLGETDDDSHAEARLQGHWAAR